jgi:crotonobetainyl-CoA:carnitine CoA-transferase CaiB-like acyl-CoA transferase
VSDEFVPLIGPAFGDLTSGAFLAGGIAAALFRRERSGRGAVVDVSLLSSGLWSISPGVVAAQLYDIETIPRFRHAESPNPLVAAYTTGDGRQIYMSGIMTEGHFENFCAVIGHPELLDDPRFADAKSRVAHAAECVAALDALFAERDLAEWRAVLAGLRTPWMVVQSTAEAGNDRQVAANDLVVEVEGPAGPYPLVASPAQFDGVPPSLRRAPDHGEHSEEILLALGRSWDDIIALKARGTVL